MKIGKHNKNNRRSWQEEPRGAGLQKNGRYAAFYGRKWGFLRIIFEIKDAKLEIITFINTENMPNLKEL